MGINQHTGEPIDPQMEGIFDNYSVKRQIVNSGYVEIIHCIYVLLYMHVLIHVSISVSSERKHLSVSIGAIFVVLCSPFLLLFPLIPNPTKGEFLLDSI